MSGAVFDFRGNDGSDYLNWIQPEPVADEQNAPAPAQSSSGRGRVGNEDDYILDYRAAQSTSKTRGGKRAGETDLIPYSTAATSNNDAGNSSKAGAVVRIPKDKVAQHQLLCLKIYAFASHERFAPAIRQSGLRVMDLDKKTMPQLEELLQRCRVVALNSSGTNGGMLHQMAWGSCRTIEAMAPKKICDLTGFAERVDHDEEAKLLMDLAAIDYGFASSMPLPVRIASCLGRIGMRVAAENQALAAAQSNAAGLQKELDQMRQQQARPAAVPQQQVGGSQQQTIQQQAHPVYSRPTTPSSRPTIDPVQNGRPAAFRDWE